MPNLASLPILVTSSCMLFAACQGLLPAYAAMQDASLETSSTNTLPSTSKAEQQVEDALVALRNGNIDRGTAMLQIASRDGNAEAMFHLAELYRLGVGRDVSVPVATMFYRLASALGHKRASLSLANILFFDGDHSEKTYSEALTVWQTLSLEGDLESTYLLGMVYWNGDAAVERDLVRGYGLVWRAAAEGYEDAIQNELVMRSILDEDARNIAVEYGKTLEIKGFSDAQLGAGLLIAEGATTAQAGNAAAADTQAVVTTIPAPEKSAFVYEKPDDWNNVWRLEIGAAMREDKLLRLRTYINSQRRELVGRLVSDSVPSVVQPGYFKLVYGPMPSMSNAVNVCVALTKAGHNCKVQAPER